MSWDIGGTLPLNFDNADTFSKSFLAIAICVPDDDSFAFVCMSTSDDLSDDDNKKLCSVSSNDADADDITPVNNCIVGASGSLSELSASMCNFSVFHHGDWQPSDAVWYDDRDCGVIVHSDAVTNDSSSVDDFTLEFSSYM